MGEFGGEFEVMWAMMACFGAYVWWWCGWRLKWWRKHVVDLVYRVAPIEIAIQVSKCYRGETVQGQMLFGNAKVRDGVNDNCRRLKRF